MAQSAMEEGAVAQLLEGATEAVAELKNLPAGSVLKLIGGMLEAAQHAANREAEEHARDMSRLRAELTELRKAKVTQLQEGLARMDRLAALFGGLKVESVATEMDVFEKLRESASRAEETILMGQPVTPVELQHARALLSTLSRDGGMLGHHREEVVEAALARWGQWDRLMTTPGVVGAGELGTRYTPAATTVAEIVQKASSHGLTVVPANPTDIGFVVASDVATVQMAPPKVWWPVSLAAVSVASR